MTVDGVDTPRDPQAAGVIGDMIEAIRRGAVGLEDRARQEIDRIRDAYARARARQALNLALFIGLAYLLLRKMR